MNPSFELETCPGVWTGWGDVFQYIPGWDTLRNGGGTPDVFDNCYTPSDQRYYVPNNYWGTQHPRSGNSYGGLVGVYNNVQVREYIQGIFNENLISGHQYCVKFFVNLSNKSIKSIVTLGAYIDDGEVEGNANNFELPNVTPQIVNNLQQLDDTLSWIKIEGVFTANGTEEYITIGNFFPDEESGIFHSYPLSTNLSAYYYIDDVSVIDMSTPAQAGNDTIIHPGESVFIGRQSEIGLNEACIWFVDGIPIDTIAGMWVTPEETTTYVLQQTLCGDIKYDTVTVVVDEFAGVFEFTKNTNEILVFPNPAREELYIHLKNKTTAIEEITIIDVAGNVYYHEQFETGVKQCGVALEMILSNGLYILEVILANGIPNRFKIMKE